MIRFPERFELFISLIIIVCCTYFAVQRSFQPEFDSDLFWHMAQGRELSSHFSLPIRDTFSINHYGEHFTDTTWIFDWVTAQIYEKWEVRGLQIFKGLIFLTSIALMLILFRLGQRPLMIALGTIFLTLGLNMKFAVRPDTVTVPILVLSLILYYCLLKKWSAKLFTLWLFALLFWVNFHASSFVGLMVAGAFVLNALVLHYRDKKKVQTFVLAGVALIIVSFLGFQASNSVLGILKFSNYMKEAITEYQPINLSLIDSSEVAGLVAGLLSAVVAAFYGRYGIVLITVILLYGAITTGRMVSVALIAFSIPIAWEGTQLLNSAMWKNFSKLLNGLAIFLLFVFFLFPLRHLLLLSQNPTTTEFRKETYPFEYLEAFKKIPSGARVFNDHDIGGFLTFYCPQCRIWIDGRTNILYSEEEFKYYNRVITFPDEFLKAVEDKKIDFVIARQRQYSNNLALMALLTKKFSIQWLSDKFVVMQRNGPHLIAPTTLLYFPECIEKISTQDLNHDKNILATLPLELQSGTKNVVMISERIKAGPLDEKEIVAATTANSNNPIVLRLLSLEAAKIKNFELASQILSMISEKIAWDNLKFAEYQLALNRPGLANQSFESLPDLGYLSSDQLKNFASLHDQTVRLLNGETSFPPSRMAAFRRISNNPGKFSGNWTNPKCDSLISDIRKM